MSELPPMQSGGNAKRNVSVFISFLAGSYNEHQRGDDGGDGGRGGDGRRQLGLGGQAEAAVAASDRPVILPREEPAADPEQAADARAAQDVRRGLQD